MLKQKITVLCHANVAGPNGKLFANHIYELDDSEYVRTLIKSENVSLIDPPSLDPAYLESLGYELCEGYVYSAGQVVGPEGEEPPTYQVFGIRDQNGVVAAPSRGPEPTTTFVETPNTIPEGIHESVPEENTKNATKDSEVVPEKATEEKE